MKKISVIVAVLALIISCQPAKKTLPIDYRETPKPTDTDLCGAAEAHLTVLCKSNMIANKYCCDVIKPTVKGKSFTQFCQETQSAGVALNPKCISSVFNCVDIDKCIGTVR